MNSKPFFFMDDRVLKRMDVNEIIYLEASNSYVKFFYHLGKDKKDDKFYLVRTTLDSALKKLPKNQFVQIHRSYAVALDLIVEIASDVLALKSGHGIVLPVSKQHYPGLLQKIEIFGQDRPVKRKTRRIMRNVED